MAAARQNEINESITEVTTTTLTLGDEEEETDAEELPVRLAEIARFC